MSDIRQTSVAMQRVVDRISVVTKQRRVERICMATHDRNNGNKMRFLFGAPQSIRRTRTEKKVIQDIRENDM
jgi:hypothetical protein